MIYFLAFFVPPLGLLLNGQPFAAIFSAFLWVICFFVGWFFWPAWLIPSGYAILAIAMKNDDRRHRELVDAIEKHGPPPGWRP
jgi:hypothetical protein